MLVGSKRVIVFNTTLPSQVVVFDSLASFEENYENATGKTKNENFEEMVVQLKKGSYWYWHETYVGWKEVY